MAYRGLRIPILVPMLILPMVVGCSSKPMFKVEHYQPAYRQSPPDPVYSRVMWSHLPEPIKPRSPDTAPLLMPEIFVELKDVTVDEAVEAIAQTMGYRWEERIGGHGGRISIHMEGTIEEVLNEVRRKSHVALSLDHENRKIRIAKRITSPTLPRHGR